MARDGAPRGRRGDRRGARPDDDVVKIHGIHAVRSVLDRRPEAVVRGYVAEHRKVAFGPLMSELAGHRIAYRLVSGEELDRVAESRHHEGVCILVKPRARPSLEAWVRGCPPAAVALLLDGVENPHNLGAIVRTAAHFGAGGVWLVGKAPLHGAFARVAEGGAEAVDVFEVQSPTPVLLALARAGFQVVGASGEAEPDLFGHRFLRRTLIVLGSEREGLSEESRRAAEVVVRIPGTGNVESLNVASAAAILLAEYARQRGLSAAERRGAPPADERAGGS